MKAIVRQPGQEIVVPCSCGESHRFFTAEDKDVKSSELLSNNFSLLFNTRKKPLILITSFLIISKSAGLSLRLPKIR